MTSRSRSVREATAGAWPPWYGPLAFFIAIGATVFIGSVAALLGGGAGGSIIATLIQDVTLVAVAIGLARSFGVPNAADFGWRPTRFKLAAGSLLAGGACFYAASIGYGALLRPQGSQDILEVLGANNSTASLIATAFIVVVVAPICEETFFRGFFYRALRNRLSAAPATLVIALVFGAIHYTGPDTLVLLPLLALLGAIFCILYERTGSIYPAIALHAFNNGLALATTAEASEAPLIAGILGVCMLATCGALVVRR